MTLSENILLENKIVIIQRKGSYINNRLNMVIEKISIY